MKNNWTKKDNLSFVNNILWYDIDEGGYIKKCLNKQAAIYVFMEISDKRRCYLGSSVNLASRLSTHRSRVINKHGKNSSSIFYNTVLKYGWLNFKFGILEYINFSTLTDIKKIKDMKTLIYKKINKI